MDQQDLEHLQDQQDLRHVWQQSALKSEMRRTAWPSGHWDQWLALAKASTNRCLLLSSHHSVVHPSRQQQLAWWLRIIWWRLVGVVSPFLFAQKKEEAKQKIKALLELKFISSNLTSNTHCKAMLETSTLNLKGSKLLQTLVNYHKHCTLSFLLFSLKNCKDSWGNLISFGGESWSLVCAFDHCYGHWFVLSSHEWWRWYHCSQGQHFHSCSPASTQQSPQHSNHLGTCTDFHLKASCPEFRACILLVVVEDHVEATFS